MPSDVHLPLDRISLDLRNPAGKPFDGVSRILSNLLVGEDGGLRRLGGFPKLGYADQDLVNQDLHDQMLQATMSHEGAVEPVTMLFEAKSSSASRRIVAATRSRIYVNGGLDRNWRMVGWNFGGGEARPDFISDATRFYAAQLGDIILLTNGLDRPMWMKVGSEPGPNHMSVDPIDDLIAMGLTTAKVVCSHRGFVFFASVVMEGNTYRNRVLWSDFNDPLSFTPLPNSLAGMVDLAADEEVLAMEVLGGSLRCYTSHRIYDVNLVGGEEIFNFRQIWEGPEVLRYRNSLVNTGNQHLWVGEDRIYYITETDRRPRTEEWLHAASGAIFNGLKERIIEEVPSTVLRPFGPMDNSSCWNLVGGFDDIRKTIWLSWPVGGSTVSDISLVMHAPTQKATIVPRGFTSFLTHSKSYRESTRLWLSRQGVCEAEVMWGEGNPAPHEFVPIHILHGLPAPPLYIKNPAECSGLTPGYAQWLADHGLCNGNPNPGPIHPPEPEVRDQTVITYLSEYVIRADGDKTPQERLAASGFQRLANLIKQQYEYFHPTVRVHVGMMDFWRSSIEATVLPFDGDSANYLKDLIGYDRRSARLNDYWLVWAKVFVVSNNTVGITPREGDSPPPYSAVIGFTSKEGPASPNQACADSLFDSFVWDHNHYTDEGGTVQEVPPEEQIHEVGPREWIFFDSTSVATGSFENLAQAHNCDPVAWHDDYVQTGGTQQPLRPWYYPKGEGGLYDYQSWFAYGAPPDVPPTPGCEDFQVGVIPPTAPITQGESFAMTAVPMGGSNLNPAEDWVYEWELVNAVPGVSHIVSTSGSIATLSLGDSLPRTLKLKLSGTGCGDVANNTTVQAMETTIPTPPPCPTLAIILDFPIPWPYGEPFNVTAVVNVSAGMPTTPDQWTYTWSLSNEFVGVSEITSRNANVITMKIGDTQPHVLTLVIDFGMPSCDYPEPTYNFTITEVPVVNDPCYCGPHNRSVCELLEDPKCDECSEGWVFIAAGAGFLCVNAGTQAPIPPEYSLKQFEPLVLQWEYYNAPTGPWLPWSDDPGAVDHPTVPMIPANYIVIGYASLAQVDPVTFGTENEKRVLRGTVEYDTDDIADGEEAWMHVWAGTGAQAGHLMWHKSKPRKVDRLSLRTSAGHKTKKTRPTRLATYNFFRSGSHLAFRIIVGNDVAGPVLGGAVAMNWMKANVLGARNDYF